MSLNFTVQLSLNIFAILRSGGATICERLQAALYATRSGIIHIRGCPHPAVYCDRLMIMKTILDDECQIFAIFAHLK